VLAGKVLPLLLLLLLPLLPLLPLPLLLLLLLLLAAADLTLAVCRTCLQRCNGDSLFITALVRLVPVQVLFGIQLLKRPAAAATAVLQF
jgi:hypothetical protein